jgi:uncharacterized membrane protein YphA (DoxX/SURF4 family)
MNIGTRVYGLGAATMGVAAIVFHLLAPAHPSAQDTLAFVEAIVLILGGVMLNLPRVPAIGAALLAAYFAASALLLAGPAVIAKPLVVGSWENFAELAALAAGGAVAYALTTGVPPGRSAAIARSGRVAFGLCLLVFGAAHFAYAKYTASLVPAWLPPGQMFWTYVTGVAQVAAGVALLSGIQARLAAVLLTVMYGLFGLLVHAPLIHGAPHTRFYWDEFFENLALMGVAWTMADAIGRKGSQPR